MGKPHKPKLPGQFEGKLQTTFFQNLLRRKIIRAKGERERLAGRTKFLPEGSFLQHTPLTAPGPKVQEFVWTCMRDFFYSGLPPGKRKLISKISARNINSIKRLFGIPITKTASQIISEYNHDKVLSILEHIGLRIGNFKKVAASEEVLRANYGKRTAEEIMASQTVIVEPKGGPKQISGCVCRTTAALSVLRLFGIRANFKKRMLRSKILHSFVTFSLHGIWYKWDPSAPKGKQIVPLPFGETKKENALLYGTESAGPEGMADYEHRLPGPKGRKNPSPQIDTGKPLY